MTAEELWEEFCTKKGVDKQTPYEAWAFCGGGPAADELAELVVNGIKFGTASLLEDYIREGEEDLIPKVGDYSIILLDSGEAVCVICDYDVEQKEFGTVSAFHGYSEGEEERTREAWRRIHKQAFETEELKVTEDSVVICEKFFVAYLPDTPTVSRLHNSKPEQVITPGELNQELLLVEMSANYQSEIRLYHEEMEKAYKEYNRNVLPNTISLICIRKTDWRLVGMIEVTPKVLDMENQEDGSLRISVRPSERKKGYDIWMVSHIQDFCSILESGESIG